MYRDDGLLALVRKLPCQVPGCQAPAPSEPMHANWARYGKGRSIKADDSSAAAGCRSCHRAIDAGSDLTGVERSELWHAAYAGTMGQLIKRGWLKVNPEAL